MKVPYIKVPHIKGSLLTRWHLPRISKADHYEIFRSFTMKTLFQLILDGAVVGILAGCITATYRYGLEYVENMHHHIISHTEITWVIGWLVAAALLGLISYYLLTWEPLSGGSGIPQIEGEVLGYFTMKPCKVLLAKYIGGLINGFVGFSAGRGGPSIHMGGTVGKLVGQYIAKSERKSRVLISAGAAAGLAATFNAPLAGTLFVYEALHKNFYPALGIPTFVAALLSNYVSSLMFGLDPSLGFTVQQGLPMNYFPMLIGLGLFIGLVGIFFNRSIIWMKVHYTKLPIHGAIKMMITFMCVAMMGYFVGDLLFSGSPLIDYVSNGYVVTAIGFLFFLFVGKTLVTAFCYGSGVPAGTFIPILVVGAAAGSFFYSVLLQFGLVSPAYVSNVVLCAMAGIMAASIRMPLLSILMVLEMTQSFENTYAVGIVTIIAYLTAELLNEPPIYKTFLSMMVFNGGEDELDQTFFEARVTSFSDLVGKELSTLSMPSETRIVSICRHDHYVVPTKCSVLESGDLLYISTTKQQLGEAKIFFGEEHVSKGEMGTLEPKDK